MIIFAVATAAAVPFLMFFFHINNFKTAGYYKIIAPSPDGRHVVTSDNGTTVYLWDMETGMEILTFRKQTAWGVIKAIDLSPDGRYAASAGNRGIILWDVITGLESRRFTPVKYPPPRRPHSAVVFSPDGKTLLTGGGGFKTVMWDVDTGSVLKSFGSIGNLSAVTNNSANPLAFSPDGLRILSGGETLKLWDVQTGLVIYTFRGHKRAVEAVAFSPDGKRAMSADNLGMIKVWDMETGEEIFLPNTGHTKTRQFVTFSKDGRIAASGDSFQPLSLISMETGNLILSLSDKKSGCILTAAVTRDGQKIVASNMPCGHSKDDGRLNLIEIKTGNRILTFKKKITLQRIIGSLVWRFVKI